MQSVEYMESTMVDSATIYNTTKIEGQLSVTPTFSWFSLNF